MQKKIIALAVAGLSTAAFAQTNVTIYGVADVSAQGYNMASGSARAFTDTTGSSTNTAGKVASGGSFNLTNNSSLIGFKGTEDLGNGLKALFQFETNINVTGQTGVAANTNNSNFGSLRDTYVGVNSKYGTALGGYLSTPFRSVVTGFDVMPGATGVGRSENLIGATKINGVTAASSIRATAIAYALPTMYGFNGAIAFTGTNNDGRNNDITQSTSSNNNNSSSVVRPMSALSMNLGWEGYGVGIKGAFQQAKVNNDTTDTVNNAMSGYTSYVIGAQYTGVPGLKVAAMYNRNTVGTNAAPYGNRTLGSMKGSNNQYWVGASYRFGNNEPRISWAQTSNTSGMSAAGIGQDGGKQVTANWGYYLSKRTQVYGIVSYIGNNANGVWNFAGTGSNLTPTGGQKMTTYGAGLRTNF